MNEIASKWRYAIASSGRKTEGLALEINGSRLGRVPGLGVWDHSYSVYTKGIRDYSASIGDIEGVKAMNLLL